ncbi:MAG: hypothetical protein Q8M20_17025 [Rhodocyclaceae bacterium]|nr:hypothetical protein [Rhodocyclaceae bacterium]MDZ4213897.1 hypothetical protein [Rhodocyclaceae bacterium]
MPQKLKLPPEIEALPPEERELVTRLVAEKLALEHVKAVRGKPDAEPHTKSDQQNIVAGNGQPNMRRLISIIADARLATGVTGVLLLLSMVFPPFYIQLPNGLVFGLGYGFLLNWPEYDGWQGLIAWKTQLVQFAGIALLYFFWKRLILLVKPSDAENPAHGIMGSVERLILLVLQRRHESRLEIETMKADVRLRIAEIEEATRKRRL